MDKLLVGASLVIPLALALAWAIWFLAAQGRKNRRTPTSHVFRGQGDAVTVAELLEDTIEQGDGIRLNWSAADEAKVQNRWFGVRPYAEDQMGTEFIPKPDDWPTEVLPRVEDPE